MIELRAPEGFHSNNLGSFPLSDGTVLRRGANGYYSFPDSVDVGSWLMQGWKLRSDIDAERKRELEAQKQRDQREAEAKALTVAEILEFVERAGGELEVRNLELYARGISAIMKYVLRIRRMDIISELSNRNKLWSKV